jgi:hypothetical protein
LPGPIETAFFRVVHQVSLLAEAHTETNRVLRSLAICNSIRQGSGSQFL